MILYHEQYTLRKHLIIFKKQVTIDGIGNGLPSMVSLARIPVQDLYMRHHLVASPFHRSNRCYLDQASRYRRV